MKIDKQSHALINSVIAVSNKFINKCETGKARSRETLSDLLKLKAEAELLKTALVERPTEPKEDNCTCGAQHSTIDGDQKCTDGCLNNNTEPTKIAEMVEDLAVDHPYYASESNYYSNEASSDWETMTEFLDEFEDADIDMNHVFRWDVSSREEGENTAGRYSAQVILIGQRKGLYLPHRIKYINDVEAKRFSLYLKKHWDNMVKIWEPIAICDEATK